MAKAAAINMSDAFSPPPQTQVITPPSTYGDFLPSLSNPAGPGPSSSASNRLSGHIKAVAAAKERASSASSYGSRRQSGAIMSVPMQAPTPHIAGDAAAVTGAGPQQQQPQPPNAAKLPPLLHGYAPSSAAPSPGPSTARTASPSAASQPGADRHSQPQIQAQAGDRGQPQQQPPQHLHPHSQHQQPPQPQGEAIQPLIQHPAMLPGPTPASHPYQPKRKPPSAFMRKNPMRQQLEASAAQQQQQHPRSASAGSARSHHGGGLYDMAPPFGHPPDQYSGRLPNELQAAQFAEEVMAAAEAAIAAGRNHGMWADDGSPAGAGGGSALGGFVAAPPWGVSSVSDLEALDSILDQLVVVDARMRKALLKGPLISFETVVPEHVMAGARHGMAGGQLPRPEDDRDRTFLTAVKGANGEEGGAGEEEGGAAEAEASRPDASALPPPPSPADFDSTLVSAVATVANARQALRGSTESDAAAAMEPRDSALFPAAIPNPGMHPTFTRAYLASKMAAKPQHLPPPPPATAEHLLRSRPPPFIAAPSYDQLCSQIRDVQRQYTCGTARPAGQAAGGSSGAGSAGASAPASAGGAAPGADVAVSATTNQYIAGLDGPTLDEVVAHQELPISLERVRPTFVALKQKPIRSASPRRRPGSPGRGGEVQMGDGGMAAGRTL